MVAVVLPLSTSWQAELIALLAAMPFLVMPVWWATNVRRPARIGELDRHAAVAAERARMARDLHDVIAGRLRRSRSGPKPC